MKRTLLGNSCLILFFIISSFSLNAAAPVVSSVTITAGNYKIGSSITVTIAADGTGYTVDAGTTINGVDVTATFASAGGNNYTLTYLVGSGNTDRASVGVIPINILIRNGAGAGNLNTYTSAPTSGGTVTIDANAPAQPAAPDLTTGTDSGTSNTDNNTNDNTPDFTGSGTTGNTITVISSLDGTKGTGTVSGGTYTITVSTLSEGTHNITVTETDPAGNVSVASTALSVTIDTTPPSAPTVPDLTAGTDSGSSSTDNITNDNTPDFSVTGTTGFKLEILVGGSTVVATAASATGAAQTLTASSLSDASYSVTARTTDVAGNTASSTALNPVIIDTAAPGQPAAPDLTAGTDLGTSSTDNITNDNTPDFTGSGTNGSTITVISSVDGTVGTGTVSSGTYTITVSALTENTHNITVIETDLAGNPSIASTALSSVVIDTTPPAAPASAPDLIVASDSGSSSTDDNTNDNTPTFDVTGTTGLRLEIVDGGSTVVAFTASATGASEQLTASSLSDGMHSITARTVDVAGNTASSGALAVTIDTAPPSAPTVPDLTAGTDSGSSSTDNITNDNTPDFSVTGTTGFKLEILVGGSTVVATAASATGAAQTLTASSLSDASYSVTARSTDVAGNTATSTALNPVIIDTAAPGQPAAPDLTAGTDLGTSSTDNITNDNTPDFTGSGTNGSTITVISSVDGTVGTGTVSSGTYTITVSALTENTHNITVIETDLAGNPSIASTALSSVVIDTTPPAAPASAPDLIVASDSGSSSTDDNTNDNTPTFDVTGTTGLRLEIVDGGSTVVAFTASATGASQQLTASSLSDGAHSITARTVDVAGNTASSGALAVTIDTAPPSAPTVPDLTAGTDSGSSSTDNITNDNTPDFSVTGTTGFKLEILVGGSTVVATAASATGAAQTLTASSLSDASYSVTARSTDVAGNTATSTALNPVIIDTGIPAVPSVPDLTAGTDSGTSTTDNITNNLSPSFTGTAENGATVQIFSSVDGGVRGSAVSSGTYTVPTTLVTQGNGQTHSITAKAIDVAGNSSTVSTGLAITLDATRPSVSSSILEPDNSTAAWKHNFSCSGQTTDRTSTTEFFHLTLSEPLALADGTQVTINLASGFSVDRDGAGATYAQAITSFDVDCSADGDGHWRGASVYHSTGNIIHLKSGADGDWNGTTTLFFTSIGTSNLKDAAGNELGTINGVTPPDTAPPFISSGLAFDPNGASPEFITFNISEGLNASVGTAPTGFTVNQPVPGTVPTAFYNSALGTITLTSASNGQWTDAIQVSYTPGNVVDPATNAMVAIANLPIRLVNISISSNNTNGFTARAKNGDDITITFNTNSPLTAAPIVTIGGQSATNVLAGPVTYSAKVTASALLAPEGSALPITINAVSASDQVDVTATTNSSQVIYDKTSPTISPVTIVSNNSLGTSVAKVGNTITLSFTVNETLFGTPSVTIGGRAASVSNVGLNYTATLVLDGSEPSGALAFNISLQDQVGNAASATAITSGSNVTYDKTPPSVQAITIVTPPTPNPWSTTNGTSASTVTFRVTFNEDVTGISYSGGNKSFQVQTTGSVGASTPTGATFTTSNFIDITVTGVTGQGKLRYDYNDRDVVVDQAGNPTGGPGNGNGDFLSSFTSNNYYSIVLPEPGNAAFAVTAPTITGNSITLQWPSPNSDTPVPTHFLILAKPTTGGSYPAVADGTYVPDAALVRNQTRISGTNTYTFTGLNSGTSYDFIIYKYALSGNNSNDNIDFETTTPGVINGVATVTASVSWATLSASSTPISSISDAQGTSTSVMSFKIYDDGLDPISPNVMNFNDNGTANETVTFTLRDQLTSPNGALLSGFSASSTGVITSAVYSGPTTNIVTLTSPSDGTWNSSTIISYSALTGNAQFVTLGKMQSIANHQVAAATPFTVFYNAPGLTNFIVPAGVTGITVEVFGAGGSGGPFFDNVPLYGAGASSGGGGGGYSRSFLPVTPGANYPVNVGAGGPGMLTGSYIQAGNDGGDSFFGSPSTVFAEGGLGGWNNDWTDYYSIFVISHGTHGFGGNSSNGVGDYKFSGGNAGIGYGNGNSLGLHGSLYGYGGGGGSSAGTSANGNIGSNGGTCCGFSPGGPAPAGGAAGGTGTYGQAGFAGTFPGGGGGGTSGVGPYFSGAGADGQVKVTYYLPAGGGTSDWAGDNSPFKFSQLVITQDASSNSPALSNWQNIIAGAELFDGTNSFSSVTNPADVTINPTNITFSNIPATTSTDVGYISDANGSISSKTYTLKVWLKNNLSNAIAATVDGLNLAFSFDPATAANLTYDDVTNSAQKSSRLTTPVPIMKSGASQIQVVASKLVYSMPGSTAPTNTNPQSQIGVNVPFSSSSLQDPEVYALDANNNLDLGYTNSANITNTQNYGQSVSTLSFSAGKLLLNPLYFTTGSTSIVNTQLVVSGTGAPTVTQATSTNVAPIISSVTTISAGAGAEPPTINSLNTIISGAVAPQLNAVASFDFSITDDVGANLTTFIDNDALPTTFNQIVISQGAGTDPVLLNNWDKVIAGAELSLTATNGSQTGLPLVVSTPANVTIGTNSITFGSISFGPGPGSPGRVDDGKSNTYTLKIYFKKPVDPTLQDLIDKTDFVFSVNETSFNPTGANTTSAIATSGVDSGNGNNTIAVTATQLDFITQWAANAAQSYDAALSPTPTAKARDVNSNLDLDWNTAATVTAAGTAPATYPLVNSAVTVSNGLLSFNSGLQVSSAGGGLNGSTATLTVTSGALTSASSGVGKTGNPFKLNYSANSDIVHDHVTFSFTHPTDVLYATTPNQGVGGATVGIDDNTEGTAMEQFVVRDGGGSPDADGSPTVLASIKFNITNFQYLRSVALFKGSGTTPIAVLPATSIQPNGDITFNLATTPTPDFAVPDNGNLSLTIQTSFAAANVIDNSQITFTVVSVTPGGVSSSFANPTPSLIGTVTASQNLIEVVTTQLDFTTQPDPLNISTYTDIANPYLVVSARDVNANIDIDYTGTVGVISNTGTTGTGPGSELQMVNIPTGNFVAGVYDFKQYDLAHPGSTFQFHEDSGPGTIQLKVPVTTNNQLGALPTLATSTTFKVASSFESSLQKDPTFNIPATIPYISYQEAANIQNTSTSYELFRALVVDGSRGPAFLYGGLPLNTGTDSGDGLPDTDVDGAATNLTALTIRIYRPSDLRRIALYSNGTEVSGTEIDVTAIGAITSSTPFYDFTWTGSPLVSASDNSETPLSFRVSFRNTSPELVDHDNIQIQLIAATVLGGSQFYNGNPSNSGIGGPYVGGGTPQATGQSLGLIDVVATSLDFVTQASTYAGINEPIGNAPPTYTTPYVSTPLPSTTAAIVHARDKFANLDLDFNFTPTITQAAGPNAPLAAPTNFASGVLRLDGLEYINTGDGTLTVSANGLNSSLPPCTPGSGGCTSLNGQLVNVVHVTATYPNTGVLGDNPPTTYSIKGGSQGQVIFGVTFTPSGATGSEPVLKKFSISFDKSFHAVNGGIVTNIFTNFVVKQGTTDVTNFPINGSLSYSLSSTSTDDPGSLDIITVDLSANPQTLVSGPLTYYLIADVDPTANISTPSLTPSIIDLGYGDASDTNIIVSKGTASGQFSGNIYTFASTKPPVLLTSKFSGSDPYSGQLNVNAGLTQIKMQFDVAVGSLDGGLNNGAELFNRTTNVKVADLIAVSGAGNFLSTNDYRQVVNPLTFDLSFVSGQSLQADEVYYVTLKKGAFNPIGNTGTGISDQGLNFYGGITSNSVLYFKIASNQPLKLNAISSSFNNPSIGTLSTEFDQFGTAYYLIVPAGSTAPSAGQVKNPTTYLAATKAAFGNYVIDRVNASQTVSFPASFIAGSSYDIYMYAENDANPAPISSGGVYGTSLLANGGGPTLTITLPVVNVSSNSPNYLLCPNSFVTLSDPIILGETSVSSFKSASVQHFFILLPPGYEFDGVTYPTIQLIGADFQGGTATPTFESNTLLKIVYTNNPLVALTTDYIVISNLRIKGVSGSTNQPIQRFYGSNTFASPTATIASIGLIPTTTFSFDNSYSVSNSPFTPPSPAIVNAIPDNYVDVDANISGSIRLLPRITVTNDYNASTFNGIGVTNDLVTLSAVPNNTAFNITMTHTDPNGCVSQKSEQYLVYDHLSPISKKLGLAYQGTPQEGTAQALVNVNFQSGGNSPAIASPTIFDNELAGYELISLAADLPADEKRLNLISQQSQIISGSAWQSRVAAVTSIPPVPVNRGILGTYYNYQWDYSHILNAVTESGGAITVNPYDGEVDSDPNSITGLKFRKSSGKNLYWTGGSLGKVEFTGVYRSTADLTVVVPFRQEVELFVPPIPILEVDEINQPVKGVPTYCEFGGAITINGFPAAAAGTSVGTFAIYDDATYVVGGTNIPIIGSAQNSAFVDIGNGTASIYPYLLNNSNVNIGIINNYKNIRVVYTYKENNSPATGSNFIVIRVSPNPVAKFDQNSDLTVFVDNTKGLSSGKASTAKAYCTGIPITFDPTGSTIAADSKAIYNWDFGDINSATNTATSTPTTPTLNNTYPTVGTYRAKLTVISDKGCSSINTDNYYDVTVGSIPVIDFDLVGISTADQIAFTDKSTALSNGSNSYSKINSVNWDYGDGVNNSTGSHQYSTPGHYVTKATVTTAIGSTSTTIFAPGCVRSYDRTIVVLDKRSGYYEDDFEGATTTWQYIRDSLNTNGLPSTQLPSWKRGTPSSSRLTIYSTPTTGTTNNKVWATGLSGTYLKNERSFLYSPALDLTGFIRPMISFDAIWDLKKDGVVLEYSIDNKNVADPTKVWQIVGSIQTGVNWINDQIIGSKPGNQPSGDFGWSGISKNNLKDSIWVESKHELSNAISVATGLRTNVVFRFGFATVNDGGEGFAFDNFRIGERTRTILLEDFVTTNSGDANKDQLISSENGAITSFIGSVGIGTTVVNLNYHIGFTGSDPFNFDNPADPSSRALYYNVKDVPWAFLDGQRPVEAIVDPKFSTWGKKAYDNQTLQLGQAIITLPSPSFDSNDGSLKFDVKVTALYDLPDNTILHVGVIEKSIPVSGLSQSQKDQIKTGESNFDYVLKRMLPNASGTKFVTALTKTQSRTFTGFEYYPDKNKLYSDSLQIVVFLQNESARNIYQTEIIKPANSLPSLITGLENSELLEHVEVFPNPADKEINILLPGVAKQSMELQLVDQVGKVVTKDSILEGTSRKTVSSHDLAAGIYILQIGSGKSGVVRKKILVVHQD